MCAENTAQGGMPRDPYSMRQSQVLHLPQETHQSAVFFVHTSKGGALSDILYFLVVLHGAIFLSTQTAVILGNQAISKCSYI